MTEWTLLKRLLDAVHQHSTMMGRLWLTVMVVFRLLVVAVATEDVYTDEQQMFVCDSRRPGCCSVCYDAFAPISQPRFWVFHIISVSTPSLCFIVYTWHNLSKLGPPGRTGPDPSGPEAYDRSCDSDGHSVLGHSLTRVLGSGGPDGARASPCGDGTAEGPPGSGGVLSRCYVLHVCLRAVLEVGFVLAQWKLFGFRVPVHFLCSSAPCGQPVDCYVSRPTEKTVFLLFMFSVGVFCILLNLLELNHLGWKKIRQVIRIRESWGLRGGYETFRPGGSPSLTSSLVFRDVTSTSSLPTLDLVVGPDWICAGSRIQKAEEVRDRPDCLRGENQTLKGQRETRGPKPRSTEVWI